MTATTYALISLDIQKVAEDHESGALRASYGYTDSELDDSVWRAIEVWPEATTTQLRFAAAAFLHVENAGYHGILTSEHGDLLAGAFGFSMTPQWVAATVIEAFTTAQGSTQR